jgi:predicted acetyltransferase
MTQVHLEPVSPAAAPILENLLELYCHDLSALFGLRIGANGRFGYPRLAHYWQETERNFAFFIRADAELAGFALATRGSPATDNPEHLDVAEFFVLRTHRASRVGARAATQLWTQLPGHWVVRVAVQNEPALHFWQRTIATYSRGVYAERTLELSGVTRRIFELDSGH